MQIALIALLAAAPLLWMIKFIGRMNAERSALRAQLCRAESLRLQEQLAPHFLYNALGAAADILRAGRVEEGTEAITTIATLHRDLLSRSGVAVLPLAEEVRFVRDYLAVEQVRFGHRLSVVWEISPDSLAAEIPTLLLHNLVENAIKHGIARRSAPGVIHLHARKTGNRLVLEVANDPADPGPAEALPSRRGVGLSNTLERLRRVTHGDYYATLRHGGPGGRVVARVELPFWAGRAGKDFANEHNSDSNPDRR